MTYYAPTDQAATISSPNTGRSNLILSECEVSERPTQQHLSFRASTVAGNSTKPENAVVWARRALRLIVVSVFIVLSPPRYWTVRVLIGFD